jgi:hypothetical protein
MLTRPKLFAETPTRSASACQCLGCGRLRPARIGRETDAQGSRGNAKGNRRRIRCDGSEHSTVAFV